MAKIDMFDGKIDETPDSEKQLNTWYDTLIGCPSQCYYYFMHEETMYCVYLRWRHSDPWTCEVIKCTENDFSLDPDTSTWKFVKIAFFEEDELEKLKEYVLNRLDIILALWPNSEQNISLRVEDYKTLPSDVREKVVGLTMKLVKENKAPERKIKTWHAGEIKGLDMLLQMEVRDYIDLHPDGLLPNDGIYVNPDTADITVTTKDKVNDRHNFYPFPSLVEYDREDGKYYVDRDATADVAFTYYEYL